MSTWRYEIQHGPDGEANYAWVYDDKGIMVCTAKTHHAIAIVEALSTAPSGQAPLEGVKAQAEHVALGIACGRDVKDATLNLIEMIRSALLHASAEDDLASVKEWRNIAASFSERLVAAIGPRRGDQDVFARIAELLSIEKAASHPASAEPVVKAWADVIAERRRQIEVEGWTPEHDDDHSDGKIAWAASAYAIGVSNLSGSVQFGKRFIPWHKSIWPWDIEWFKPTNPRRNLVKAGALILAEIERLDRAERRSTEDH